MDKRGQRAWILAGLALAAGVGLVYAMGERPPKLQKGAKLLLLGDSMAEGIGPHLQPLALEEGVKLKVLAKSGTRISQWAESKVLDDILRTYEPDLVLVALGTNDEYLDAAAVPAVREAALLLLEKFQRCCAAPGPYRGDYGLGAEVVWIGPPALPKDSNGVTAVLREVSPQYFASDELELPRAPDRLHPTASGYAAWAGAIWQWLS